MMASYSRKITELDALRGLAALVVFTGHFFEGLFPSVLSGVSDTLWEAAFNGPAAVILFFVLSGFVLALQPIKNGTLAGPPVAMVRRWPRLAGTVTVASLGYIALAASGAFPGLTQLPRIHGPVPPYLFWGQSLHDEQAGSVLSEAVSGTFLYGTAQHNAVLWTMHWELLGSFLALALAFALILPVSRFVRAGLFMETLKKPFTIRLGHDSLALTERIPRDAVQFCGV